jgi:hypothetical protein
VADKRLPIKVVIAQYSDYFVPETGGGSRTVFGQVTGELRQSLSDQVSTVERDFAESFQRWPDIPAVATVKLKKEALAKSHRPQSLFDDRTCPIIGIDEFGELLMAVQPQGLKDLKSKLLTDKTKIVEANISTIEEIKPYKVEEDQLAELVSKVQEGLSKVKLRLFRYKDQVKDTALLRGLLELMNQLGLPEPELLNYGKRMRIMRVTGIKPENVLQLAGYVGTQNISEFPEFYVVRELQTGDAIEQENFPPPEPGIEYPVVGLIDSGTPVNDPILSPWRVDRFHYFLPQDQDNWHGSFVAGLLTHPRQLNNGDPRFPVTQSKFIDVVALPREGGTEKLTEDTAVEIVAEVLERYRGPKVWNLSFGSNKICKDSKFSDYAMSLDSLQDEHDVTLVLAAGNLNKRPLRKWPPTQNLGNRDRICGPADSVRGVTVGAIAHVNDDDSYVRTGEPAPYSRRGPGPAYIPKPEVTHYGGNCTERGEFQGKGVCSFDGNGNIAESIGTSFSAPLVANILSNIHHAAKEPMSRNLAKALLVHSAVLSSEHVEKNELRYRGFGIPSDVESILSCDDWAATLVFEGELWQLHNFEKRQFPIPVSFRTPDGKVCGDFAMTLVYDPPLDPTYGAEYCRSNIEVSLGSYDLDAKTGKRKHKKLIPEESGDYKERYEQYLIEHGFKWSPVKVYRRSIPQGIQGNEWRLLIDRLNRADYLEEGPQKFALIISMWDRDKGNPIYNEVVRAMVDAGWVTQNLELRTDIRLTPRY